MVAKKTAVQKTAPAGSTGAARSNAPAKARRSGSGAARNAASETPGKGKGKISAAAAAAAASPRKPAAGSAPVRDAARSAAAAADRTPAAGRTAGRTTAAPRVAGKRTGGKAPAKKREPARPATGTAPAAPEPHQKTGATTVVAKKTPGGAPPPETTPATAATALSRTRARAAGPEELPVRPGEEPWSAEEVDRARAGLLDEELRLRAGIDSSEEAITGLMRDSGDGAGDDQADTGSKNITREHELALAANAREMLTQTERALQELDAGTYGLCESCGKPIGKARMQAFPRATLCVDCKQRQERR
jgi:RNA polymerase-binding protein DksA